MRLEKLELSGFKSFAKQTSFDLTFPIIAIVGPNGSGKSNLVEAIKWVLGEQSLKELRSKQGTDLIFSGGAGERAHNNAKVSLVFKNSPSASGLDFDKLIISRQVWRDGLNQYFINGSAVRLKDIASLLAKIGLGGKKHLIVSQGETDRILAVSGEERKEMIEDALGLKVYHLKQKEALQKLERTKENINRIKDLRQEIKPHLNFLEKQAKKFERAAMVKEKLKELYKLYLSKEGGYLEAKAADISQRKKPIESELERIKKRHQVLSREFSEKIENKEDKRINDLEIKLHNLYSHRLELERNYGKLEGIIELEKSRLAHSEEEYVSREDVDAFLEEIEVAISSMLEENILDRIYELANDALGLVRSFSDRIHSNVSSVSSRKVEELLEKRDKLSAALRKIVKEENQIKSDLDKIKNEEREGKSQLKELEKELSEIRTNEAALKEELNLIILEEERIKLERENYFQEKEAAAAYLAEEKLNKDNFADENERRELKKELDRLKIKAEESAAADESILKEYQDIKSRDEFLEKELADLEQSEAHLNKVMKELSEKLKVDFKNGLNTINNKFQKFFGLMFEGGRARLYLSEEERQGVDIAVSLPRKKVKSLQILSGGERSLVSIALIFALIETNPPPFLVLDETDAALDEANSLRYGKILRELSKRTQLLAITHNRQTMSQAQVLYGITMDGKGVSKTLSLKFEPELIKEYA